MLVFVGPVVTPRSGPKAADLSLPKTPEHSAKHLFLNPIIHRPAAPCLTIRSLTPIPTNNDESGSAPNARQIDSAVHPPKARCRRPPLFWMGRAIDRAGRPQSITQQTSCIRARVGAARRVVVVYISGTLSGLAASCSRACIGRRHVFLRLAWSV